MFPLYLHQKIPIIQSNSNLSKNSKKDKVYTILTEVDEGNIAGCHRSKGDRKECQS